jgi:hypothetical protein
MHCMTRYTSTCGIMAMGLLYRLDDMVKCVCYMGLGSNGCFMAGVALMGGHYRMDIISSVGHPRSDLVVPLVLCTVVYNIQGSGVVL